MPTTADAQCDPSFRAFVDEQLERLKRSPGLRVITFPPTLTAAERLVLYELVAHKGLWRKVMGRKCFETVLVARSKDLLNEVRPTTAQLDKGLVVLDTDDTDIDTNTQQQQTSPQTGKTTGGGDGGAGAEALGSYLQQAEAVAALRARAQWAAGWTLTGPSTVVGGKEVGMLSEEAQRLTAHATQLQVGELLKEVTSLKHQLAQAQHTEDALQAEVLELSGEVSVLTSRLHEAALAQDSMARQLAALHAAAQPHAPQQDPSPGPVPALEAVEGEGWGEGGLALSGEPLSPEAVVEAKALVTRLRAVRLPSRASLSSLPPSVRAALSSAQRSLGKALDKLAHDIYSHRGRAVLELLQNADDAHYHTHTQPAMHMLLWAGQGTGFLVTYHNERGFSPRDVDALCQVGESSKALGEGSGQAIGRKGIGFKSLFGLSSCPTVLSGPMAFRFDAATLGPYGYICPEWVEDVSGVITGPLAKAQTALPPSSLEAHGGQGPEQWGRLAVQGQGTVVYAPLAPANTTLTHTQDLLTGVELPGLCLAFLRHIRQLSLTTLLSPPTGPPTALTTATHVTLTQPQPVAVEGQGVGGMTYAGLVKEIGGDAVRHSISTVTVTTTTHSTNNTTPTQPPPRQRLYSLHSFTLPHPSLPPETLCVAFPLTDDDDEGEEGGEWVFAYLPVARTGLPFAVHANWDLTTNRQECSEGSAKNAWLWHRLARCLLLALHSGDPSLEQGGKGREGLLERWGPGLGGRGLGKAWRQWARDVQALVQVHCLVATEEGGPHVPLTQALQRPHNLPPSLVDAGLLLGVCGSSPLYFALSSCPAFASLPLPPLSLILKAIEQRLHDLTRGVQREGVMQVVGAAWGYLGPFLTQHHSGADKGPSDDVALVLQAVTSRLPLVPIRDTDNKTRLRRLLECGMPVLAPPLPPCLLSVCLGDALCPLLVPLLQASAFPPPGPPETLLRLLPKVESQHWLLSYLRHLRLLSPLPPPPLVSSPGAVGWLWVMLTKGLGLDDCDRHIMAQDDLPLPTTLTTPPPDKHTDGDTTQPESGGGEGSLRAWLPLTQQGSEGVAWLGCLDPLPALVCVPSFLGVPLPSLPPYLPASVLAVAPPPPAPSPPPLPSPGDDQKKPSSALLQRLSCAVPPVLSVKDVKGLPSILDMHKARAHPRTMPPPLPVSYLVPPTPLASEPQLLLHWEHAVVKGLGMGAKGGAQGKTVGALLLRGSGSAHTLRQWMTTHLQPALLQASHEELRAMAELMEHYREGLGGEGGVVCEPKDLPAYVVALDCQGQDQASTALARFSPSFAKALTDLLCGAPSDRPWARREVLGEVRQALGLGTDPQDDETGDEAALRWALLAQVGLARHVSEEGEGLEAQEGALVMALVTLTRAWGGRGCPNPQHRAILAQLFWRATQVAASQGQDGLQARALCKYCRQEGGLWSDPYRGSYCWQLGREGQVLVACVGDLGLPKAAIAPLRQLLTRLLNEPPPPHRAGSLDGQERGKKAKAPPLSWSHSVAILELYWTPPHASTDEQGDDEEAEGVGVSRGLSLLVQAAVSCGLPLVDPQHSSSASLKPTVGTHHNSSKAVPPQAMQALPTLLVAALKAWTRHASTGQGEEWASMLQSVYEKLLEGAGVGLLGALPYPTAAPPNPDNPRTNWSFVSVVPPLVLPLVSGDRATTDALGPLVNAAIPHRVLHAMLSGVLYRMAPSKLSKLKLVDARALLQQDVTSSFLTWAHKLPAPSPQPPALSPSLLLGVLEGVARDMAQPLPHWQSLRRSGGQGLWADLTYVCKGYEGAGGLPEGGGPLPVCDVACPGGMALVMQGEGTKVVLGTCLGVPWRHRDKPYTNKTRYTSLGMSPDEALKSPLLAAQREALLLSLGALPPPLPTAQEGRDEAWAEQLKAALHRCRSQQGEGGEAWAQVWSRCGGETLLALPSLAQALHSPPPSHKRKRQDDEGAPPLTGGAGEGPAGSALASGRERDLDSSYSSYSHSSNGHSGRDREGDAKRPRGLDRDPPRDRWGAGRPRSGEVGMVPVPSFVAHHPPPRPPPLNDSWQGGGWQGPPQAPPIGSGGGVLVEQHEHRHEQLRSLQEGLRQQQACGDVAEWAAYHFLTDPNARLGLHPGDVLWLSGAAARHNMAQGQVIDDGLGYDMRVFDRRGLIAGMPNTWLHVEVKGTTRLLPPSGPAQLPLYMTPNELNAAAALGRTFVLLLMHGCDASSGRAHFRAWIPDPLTALAPHPHNAPHGPPNRLHFAPGPGVALVCSLLQG